MATADLKAALPYIEIDDEQLLGDFRSGREVVDDPGREWEVELWETLRANDGLTLPQLRDEFKRRAKLGLLSPLTWDERRFDCAFHRLRRSDAIRMEKGERWVVIHLRPADPPADDSPAKSIATSKRPAQGMLF